MKLTAIQILILINKEYELHIPNDILEHLAEVEDKQRRDDFYDGWFSKSENIDINLDENYNLR
jgi:DNA polymerase II large subunit